MKEKSCVFKETCTFSNFKAKIRNQMFKITGAYTKLLHNLLKKETTKIIYISGCLNTSTLTQSQQSQTNDSKLQA